MTDSEKAAVEIWEWLWDQRILDLDADCPDNLKIYEATLMRIRQIIDKHMC